MPPPIKRTNSLYTAFKSNSEPSNLDQLLPTTTTTTTTNSLATSHLQGKYFSSQQLESIDEQHDIIPSLEENEHPHLAKDDNLGTIKHSNNNKVIDEQDFSNFTYSYEAIIHHKQIFSIFKQFILSKKMEEVVEFLESVRQYRLICKTYLSPSTPSTPSNGLFIKNSLAVSDVSIAVSPSSTDSHDHDHDELSHGEITLTFLDHLEDGDELVQHHNAITIPNSFQSDFPSSYSSELSHQETLDKVWRVANSIVETYICSLSPKELNLPHNLKEKTIRSCQKKFQEESPEYLFRKVELFVHESLKSNYFHSFLKSDMFHNFVLKSGRTIETLHEIGTLKDGIEYMAVESMADLKNQNFALSDFAFLKRKVFCGEATNSKEWVLAVNKKHYKCYFTKDRFDFGNSVGLKFFKFEIVFPFNVHNVLKTFTNQNYRQKIDEYIYDIQTIKYVEEPPQQSSKDKLFTSVINHEKYKLIWPIKDREIIVCTSSVYDRVSNLHIIGFKSCDSIDLTTMVEENTSTNCVEQQSSGKSSSSTKRNKIIKACVVGGWFFETISENETKFHEIYYIDMKGSIPKLMMDKVITNRASKFYKLGLKYLKENEKKGFLPPERDAHMYSLFQKCGDVYLR